jgi:hypothetical protein
MSAVLRRCTPFVTVVCTLAALAACTDSAAPPTATPSVIRDLTVPVATGVTVQVLPGLNGASPRSIDEFDEVVGSTSAGVPFYWSASRGVVLLAHPGYATAVAVSINDHGAMSGTAGGTTPVVWEPLPGGQFQPFEKPASQNCTAAGLNFDGDFVGTCTGGGVSYGTVFNWHGAPTETAGYQYNAISDDGWIAGAENNGTAATAAIVIDPSGTLTVLKGHDGATHMYSAVNAVALHGYLAGYSTEEGCTQAIVWGLFTANHDTWPSNLLGACGEATGITPEGYVVGFSFSGWAFVWDENPGPGLQALPGLGTSGETSKAVAISLNDALGTITSNGVTYTVIWHLPSRS